MTLADVTQVILPRRCAAEVHAHLRAAGRRGHEGMGLWVGRREGRVFTISSAVIPEQRHLRTSDGVCVMVGPEELHRINVGLFRERLTLLGQIHSHPGRAYHSDTDDRFAIASAVGCLSLVVPDFAAGPFDLARFASYRLDGEGRWREVPSAAMAALFRLVD